MFTNCEMFHCYTTFIYHIIELKLLSIFIVINVNTCIKFLNLDVGIMLVKELTFSELKAAIEVLRKEMIHCGLNNGLTNERTVQISQILDSHISQYHSLKNQ